MAQLVKLFNEKQLLVDLQAESLILIRTCNSIEPIKRFVQCYDILRLTWDIQEKHPKVWPDLECDEAALLYLRTLTRELIIGYGPELPRPGFDSFDTNVRRLLRVFGVPRKVFENARAEDGTALWQETDVDLSPMHGVVRIIRRPDDEG